MIWTRPSAAFSFRVAVALAVTALPSLAAVTVSNTSNYVGAGRWDWTIFVDADPAMLQEIKCVVYTLHPTFPDPVVEVCAHPETKFALSRNGWGTFTVKVKILYKDGRVEYVDHQLIFKQQTAPTTLNVTVENSAKEIEPGWWEWSIYIKGTPDEIKQIRCVEYTLHPSFPNPVRLVCTPNNHFLLTARGWGTFKVPIKVMLKDGSIRELSHQLEFH